MAIGASLLLAGLLGSTVGASPSTPAASSAPPSVEEELPPAECVALLRSARLAGERGDATQELALLDRAAERFPAELAPLMRRFDYLQRHGASPAELQTVTERLTSRLEDPAFRPPAGVLDQLAHDPAASTETLQAIARALARRLRETEAPEPALATTYADVQELLGKLDDAASTLEQLQVRVPTMERRSRLYGLAVRRERWSDAARFLGEMVAAGQSELRASYVQALLNAGEVDLALTELAILERDLPPEDPFSFAALLGAISSSAWTLRDLGRDAEAESCFRRLVALNPGDTGARAALLHLYGDAEERAADAAAVAEHWRNTDDPQELLDEGTQRLAAGDAAGAYDLLERAAQEFPNLEAAQFNLGLAAYRLERWGVAAEGLGRAAEIAPANFQAQLYAGLALVKLDRCAAAIAPLEAALTLDATKAALQAHYHLAQCYKKLGNAAAAAEHTKRYQAAKGG